jgi:pimeloyl-ACP methyl ester carboxylesterase
VDTTVFGAEAVVRYRAAEAVLWRHYGAAPSERVLELSSLGLRVRVQEVGRGASGTPVLFVHGGPNAGSAFAPLAAAMTGRRCVILDRPGCGLSGPVDYDAQPLPRLAAAVVAAALDALGIETVDVVGSSFGGAWALWFALAHPERVNRLVLLGAPALVPQMIVPRFMQLMLVPVLGTLLSRMPPSVGGSRWTHRQMGHSAAAVEAAIPLVYWQWGVRLMADTPTMANDLRAIRKVLTRGRVRPQAELTVDQLRSIAAPTLLYWGDADTFGGADLARATAGLIRHAVLQLEPGAGHLPWLDDPARCAAAVSAFLEGPQRAVAEAARGRVDGDPGAGDHGDGERLAAGAAGGAARR